MQSRKVAVYGRVSDTENVRESSAPLQITEGVKFATPKWPDAGSVPFQEVKTAENIRGRPIFCEMLARAMNGEFCAIVVRDQDRLSRSTEETLYLLRDLEKKGVEVWAYRTGQQIRIDTPEEKLRTSITAAFSAHEREMTAVRTRAKVHAMRDEGKWTGGNVPRGYLLSVEKALVLDPKCAPTVARVFKVAGETRSLAEAFRVAKTMDLWAGKQSVQAALRNRVYLGEWRKSDGTWIKNHHPALVDEVTFNRAQKIKPLPFAIRVPKVDRVYLLRGLVFCKHCERPMRHHHTLKKNGLRIHYYDCKTSRACPVKRIPAEPFEEWAWNELAKLCQQPKVLQAALKEHERSCNSINSVELARLNDVQRHLREVQLRQKTLMASVEKLLTEGHMLAPSLNEKLTALDIQIQELRAEEARAKLSAKPSEKIDANKFLRALREVLSDGNARPHRKQAVMKALVKQIVVSEEAIEMHLIDPTQEWFALASNMAPRPGLEPGTP